LTQASRETIEDTSLEASTQDKRSFAFFSDDLGVAMTPWKAAFPDREPQGYCEVFSKRCVKINQNSNGLVDEETAKRVWLSILREYDEYVQMGMWLPGEILEQHRTVAETLGWIEKLP
jgi:hypothetical protein